MEEDKKLVENTDELNREQKAEQGGAQKEEKLNWKKELLSWVLILVIAYVLAQVVTRVIIIKTEIVSGSMIATLKVNDRVVGNRLAYLFKDPQRGDIIFFKYPDNEEEVYVKRIIGLPGETVEVVEGQVYIDGVAIDEPYLNEPMLGSYGPYEVPDWGYFMMGDNRNISVDSRFWIQQFVTEDEILGKAWFRYKPSLGVIHSATYD